MKVIFDNNIWISFLIGKRLSLLRPLLDYPSVEIYYCSQLEAEFMDVAHRPKIMKYVGETQITRVHQLMISRCKLAITLDTVVTPVRDPKDVYLLALADAIDADILVSGDSDLTDLGQHNRTRIIDFSTFVRMLLP